MLVVFGELLFSFIFCQKLDPAWYMHILLYVYPFCPVSTPVCTAGCARSSASSTGIHTRDHLVDALHYYIHQRDIYRWQQSEQTKESLYYKSAAAYGYQSTHTCGLNCKFPILQCNLIRQLARLTRYFRFCAASRVFNFHIFLIIHW
jgi:hypothetical protein